MQWLDPEFRESGDVAIPRNWLLLHYFDALNVLFRFENTLRLFVYCVLKAEFGSRWTDQTLSGDDSAEGTIASVAKRRIAQAQSCGYVGSFPTCPVMYLTSGELSRVITSDGCWKHFSRHFAASRDVAKYKFLEINSVRNTLAHFRTLQFDDVLTVKQGARHLLGLIERWLTDLLWCSQVVPTNTEQDWYKALSVLGSELCTLQLLQSTNRDFVALDFVYSCPILRSVVYTPTVTMHSVLTIRTSSLLTAIGDPPDKLIAITERVSRFGQHGGDGPPAFHKQMRLLVPRKALEAEPDIVRQFAERVLSQVATQTDLIQRDNLAAGSLIETAMVWEQAKGAPGSLAWSLPLDALKCPVGADDPPEYWGESLDGTNDPVSDLSRFPWMPNAVSLSRWPG